MKPTYILLFLTPKILALPAQDDLFHLDLLVRKAGLEDRCIDIACTYTPLHIHSHSPHTCSHFPWM